MALRKNKDPKSKAEKEHRPYIYKDDEIPESAKEKAAITLPMVLLSILLGFVVGLIVWAVLWLSTTLTELLWNDGIGSFRSVLEAAGIFSWWVPICACTLGGLIIGIVTRFFGGAPQDLEKVLAEVKATGGYSLKRPFVSIIGFLMPLVFGGSIGPEAGLTGIIAYGCTRINIRLKNSVFKIKGLADVTVSATLSAVFGTPLMGIVSAYQDAMPVEKDEPFDPAQYDFRRNAKLVLYISAAVGAMAGIHVFTMIFGAESGLPSFSGLAIQLGQLWWAIPCMLVGYVTAFLYHFGHTFFGWLSNKMGERPILKPVLAGLVLGTVAIWLPNVMFPGEAQSFELMAYWQKSTFAVLLLTGLVKAVVTPMCLSFGWRGGHFFPCIFAGISCGYAMAFISGIDPMFCVAVVTASTLAGIQRKPLVCLALLLLCFPLRSIAWMALACVVVAYIPMPKKILGEFVNEDVQSVKLNDTEAVSAE